jgi:hypothetical protein
MFVESHALKFRTGLPGLANPRPWVHYSPPRLSPGS